jgi:hypothetical protein
VLGPAANWLPELIGNLRPVLHRSEVRGPKLCWCGRCVYEALVCGRCGYEALLRYFRCHRSAVGAAELGTAAGGSVLLWQGLNVDRPDHCLAWDSC